MEFFLEILTDFLKWIIRTLRNLLITIKIWNVLRIYLKYTINPFSHRQGKKYNEAVAFLVTHAKNLPLDDTREVLALYRRLPLEIASALSIFLVACLATAWFVMIMFRMIISYES